MKNSKNHPLGILFAVAIGFFFIASTASAQDPLIAIGKVNFDGTEGKFANTVGGTVTSIRNGVVGSGSYTITVDATGAFTGAVAADFLVELTMQRLSTRDDVAKASIALVTPDQLVVDVQVDDVEDATDTSAEEARDLPFFFTIYRAPATFPASGTTRFLIATGEVSQTGAPTSRVGVDGVAVGSSRSLDGNYDVTLTKTGAFAGASADDFVVILTVRAINDQDRGIRGFVTVTSNDVVTIDVRVDELQDEADDNNPEPIDDQFYFTIYRITPDAGIGLAKSKLLVAMGSAPGLVVGTVPLTSGGAFNGGTVTRTRNGPGDFTVTISSPGAFTGKTTSDYALQLCLNQSGSQDHAITGIVRPPDANTLEFDVFTNDVEQATNSEGVPSSQPFYFFLYDTNAAFQPDLRIAAKRNPALHRGNDIYNATSAQQRISLRLNRTRVKKYFFSLENDGNVTDNILLKANRSGPRIRTKYFQTTGGRQNVSSGIRNGLAVQPMPPCQILKYEVRTKYKRPNRRPRKTLRYRATSQFLGTQLDANLAKLRRR